MNGLKVYERSVHGGVHIARGDRGDVLVVKGETRPLDHEAAAYLREEFPFTAPVPVLRRERTMGVGDRLGIACPGHIRAFERFDASPVFAQQSMRELNLTNRSYRDVLDAVTFAVFREDFRGGFGADGDHLKRQEDVQTALSLGYTMITLDCSEHIREDGGRAVLTDELKQRYLGGAFSPEDGLSLTFSEDALAEAQHIYGGAVSFAASVWERFFARGQAGADFEISIDETSTPTTPLQHFFVAGELRRRGVDMATVAPRFCGEFQKGIDYIGDLRQFDRELRAHAAIARHYGHKLSIHSGSDKFSVFPSIGRETRGVFHLKTAGTSWLEAVRVVAARDPALYREVHAFALKSFSEAKKYYHVTTELGRVPPLASLSNAQLPGLLEQDDARQLIHITYGLILGDPQLRSRLYRLLDERSEDYAQALDRHIGRHLQALGVPERA